jgi:hypothetical protein
MVDRGTEIEQIRTKIFDLYRTHADRLKSQISFDQFWYDFLIKQADSELSLSSFYEYYRDDLKYLDSFLLL